MINYILAQHLSKVQTDDPLHKDITLIFIHHVSESDTFPPETTLKETTERWIFLNGRDDLSTSLGRKAGRLNKAK
jgi:hypothetical protein